MYYLFEENICHCKLLIEETVNGNEGNILTETLAHPHTHKHTQALCVMQDLPIIVESFVVYYFWEL